MQQNNHIYLIAILLSTLLGCKEQKSQTSNQTKSNTNIIQSNTNIQKDSNTIIISTDLDKMDEISIHDIFDKVEMIPLETTDESLMKFCQKVVCHNNRYYILEENRIFVYDAKGRFLWKIDDRGQGPEQYISIADFDINHRKNSLVFVSPESAVLHEYSLDGSFINKQKLPPTLYSCSDMKFLNSDTIAFWTFDFSNRLKLYFTGGNRVLKACIPEKDNDFSAENRAFYSCTNNYFTKTVNNDIYEIMPDNEISVAYAWDFGKLNVDAEKLERTNLNSSDAQKSFLKKLFASENINYLFTTLGSNSNYLYTQVIRKNKRISVLYNKNNQKVSVFEKTKEGLHFYPLYWTDDFVIGCIQEHLPLIEKDFEKIIPDAILDAESIEKKKQRDEFDNPFFIKYYFKK